MGFVQGWLFVLMDDLREVGDPGDLYIRQSLGVPIPHPHNNDIHSNRPIKLAGRGSGCGDLLRYYTGTSNETLPYDDRRCIEA